MNRLPDQVALEQFFRTSYISTNGKDNPFYYDHVKFVTSVGEERVVTYLHPSEGFISIAWAQKSVIRLTLAFWHIDSLEISTSAGSERLIGHIKNSETDQLFKLTLFPEVSFDLASAKPQYD
jgi:hypothetical protein